jgi:hypothetical protein
MFDINRMKSRLVGGVPQPSSARPSPRPFTSLGLPLQKGMNSFGSRGLAIAAQRFGTTFNRIKSMAVTGPEYEDDFDEEDLSFIDDGPVEGINNKWKEELRGITGYNPTQYLENDEEACESSWIQQEAEEIRSARIAAHEDAVEFKRIQVSTPIVQLYYFFRKKRQEKRSSELTKNFLCLHKKTLQRLARSVI